MTTDGEVVRRLLPDPGTLTLDGLYTGLTFPEGAAGDAGAAGQDAWVAVSMVTSIDGAVSVEGLSGGLGGPADLRALSRLRGANDVSVVGAGTIRDEGYGPLTGNAQRRADRVARGLTPSPRLAIVTGSGRISPDHPVFSDPAERPIVLVSAGADADAVTALHGVAEVHALNEEPIAATSIVATLVRLGYRRMLCEGGPTLNQAMLAADLIDEFFLTLAPTAVGGKAGRIVTGDIEVARDLDLCSVFEHGGDLLLRYRHPRHRDRDTR